VPPSIPSTTNHQWSSLNKQQVGAYCEYFVKMELTMRGFQVYTTEVDDRGVDFVCRYGRGCFFEVQVKAVRTRGSVFLFKSKFPIEENFYLALGLMSDGSIPELYLIPAIAWRTPSATFGSNDYGEGYKSKPEWRLSLSAKSITSLEQYRFARSLAGIIEAA
jgi:hypothetical protein